MGGLVAKPPLDEAAPGGFASTCGTEASECVRAAGALLSRSVPARGKGVARLVRLERVEDEFGFVARPTLIEAAPGSFASTCCRVGASECALTAYALLSNSVPAGGKGVGRFVRLRRVEDGIGIVASPPLEAVAGSFASTCGTGASERVPAEYAMLSHSVPPGGRGVGRLVRLRRFEDEMGGLVARPSLLDAALGSFGGACRGGVSECVLAGYAMMSDFVPADGKDVGRLVRLRPSDERRILIRMVMVKV